MRMSLLGPTVSSGTARSSRNRGTHGFAERRIGNVQMLFAKPAWTSAGSAQLRPAATAGAAAAG